MCARHSTKIALVVACLVALTAAGAALARTPHQSDATSTTAPLFQRVLELGELKGFWSVTCPVAVTSTAQWAVHSGQTTELARNGFLNGLREPLRNASPSLAGWSVVAQFRTATGARRETRSVLEQAPARNVALSRFTVAGIPDGDGYTLTNGSTSRLVIAFTSGRFEYELAITGAVHSEAEALRGRLIDAATTLYLRAAR